MIDEIICELDSPGITSAFRMIVLLSEDPKTGRGADTGHKQRKCAARVVCALWRSELVGCGVRLAHIEWPSLSVESAS